MKRELTPLEIEQQKIESLQNEIATMPINIVINQITSIDTRCAFLSKVIDNNPGENSELELLYGVLMDERDILVQRRNELS